MQIPLEPKEHYLLKKISQVAQELGVPAYVVGGFTRDKILKRPVKDIDIVCVGDGLALAEAVSAYFSHKYPLSLFKNFGTAQLKLPDYEIEFVGARTESYASDSRKPLVEAGNLQDDQNRRDFTINALAISLQPDNYGELLDPFNGVADLQNKIIRTPLAPEATFSDDPLRMLRAIRFASQLQFTIEENTLAGIHAMRERISIISQERITDEVNKIILSKKPSIGFAHLFETGLLSIIFKEMQALAGAEYIDGKGHKDNFWHTLEVLDNICHRTKNLWLRWAAILHDIAKPPTKKFEEGHGFTFHGHEVVGSKMVPKIFRQWKLPLGEEMRFVQKMVFLHLRPISLTKNNITDSAIRRLLFDAGNDYDSLMQLCESDITSKNPNKVKRYLENFELVRQKCADLEARDAVRNWQPPITGEIIMEHFNLNPSKQVGDIKNAVKEAMLDGIIPSTLEAGRAYMIKLGEEQGLTNSL
jgi:poly(A) polymerase